MMSRNVHIAETPDMGSQALMSLFLPCQPGVARKPVLFLCPEELLCCLILRMQGMSSQTL